MALSPNCSMSLSGTGHLAETRKGTRGNRELGGSEHPQVGGETRPFPLSFVYHFENKFALDSQSLDLCRK